MSLNSSVTYLKIKKIVKCKSKKISNQLVMLASSNIEGASRMSNLQGNAHDPWDEDERQKIYLITIA